MGHMRNMRRLIPLLVFNAADWQKPGRARRRALAAKPNIDLFNGVSESKITNLQSIVYEAVSGAMNAPGLINNSLQRCDYMLELLMDPVCFTDPGKGVLTEPREENEASDALKSLFVFRDVFVCFAS